MNSAWATTFILGDRNGVRTPMQWTGDRNAGFSKAETAQLYLPLNVDPVYGYQALNVEAQLRVPNSLLNWTKRILAVRKKHRTFGRGTLEFLKPANRAVLAYVRKFEGETLHDRQQFAGTAQPVELDLRRFIGAEMIELLGDTQFPRDRRTSLPTQSGAVRILLVQDRYDSSPRAMSDPRLSRIIDVLEQEGAGRLADYLARQRWFGSKGRCIAAVRLMDAARLAETPGLVILAIFYVEFTDGPGESYFLPLIVRPSETTSDSADPAAIPLAEDSEAGAVSDATHDSAASLALVQAIGKCRTWDGRRGVFTVPRDAGGTRRILRHSPPAETDRGRAKQYLDCV